MSTYRVAFAAVLTAIALAADLRAQERPNPALADSPWPTYHHGGLRQASTAARGPEPGDALEVQTVRFRRLNGASPWTLLGEPYPDGSVPVFGATVTHVVKSVIRPDGAFEFVDALRLDRSVRSVNWNLVVLRGNEVVVVDPSDRALTRVVDRNARRPDSPLREAGQFVFPEDAGGASHLAVTHDGWIVAPTDRGQLFAVRADFTDRRAEVRRLDLPGDDEYTWHNSFPVAPDGAIFLGSQRSLLRVDWTGRDLRLAWEAPYRFRAPGCREPRDTAQDVLWFLSGNPCSGSGTTPTVIEEPGGRRLVAVVDGHQPNNLVLFWADDVPRDWRGLRGQDRRVAAVEPVPYATARGRGFNVENSPAAWGTSLFLAQYNGINPREDPLPGVQRMTWDPRARRVRVDWATDAVALNNVLTYSDGSGLVYGSGRVGDVFHFYGLDARTGRVVIDVPMGEGSLFVDGGNGVTLDRDRSAMFGTGGGIVRVRPADGRRRMRPRR